MNTLPVPPRRPSGRYARGFSLIEIMVGLVIAMIGVIIMMEVLITSEQRTRTTNAGNEATSGGAVMLHMLTTDLKQAGYGFNNATTLGCSITVPTGAVVPLAPVVINPATSLIPAGDANTDTLLVAYGSGNGQPEGNKVTGIAGSVYKVQAAESFAPNDYVVAAPCTTSGILAKVTAASPATLSVTVNTVQAGATTLYNLGAAPRIVAYAVRNGSLTSCDFMTNDCRTNSATNWVAVSGNIVSLRLQYGHGTAANGQVSSWNQTTPATQCDWMKTPAVRLALLARSTQYETTISDTTKQRTCEAVTGATPLWTGSSGTPNAPFVLSNSDWQCYRYKTFESTAPARNIIWSASDSGC
ncbi:PilW family protein [Ramlibacter sp.]|uniref:PilW family protein n=1 Tax=Ramlibacter sp. TaxID=1917967 RepID=UPI00261818D9|nr:PilW family protein [Ramlibacter sp.]MDB5958649.1 pilW [Ramlibacter sp.]